MHALLPQLPQVLERWGFSVGGNQIAKLKLNRLRYRWPTYPPSATGFAVIRLLDGRLLGDPLDRTT
jgi:hypothetical protein